MTQKRDQLPGTAWKSCSHAPDASDSSKPHAQAKLHHWRSTGDNRYTTGRRGAEQLCTACSSTPTHAGCSCGGMGAGRRWDVKLSNIEISSKQRGRSSSADSAAQAPRMGHIWHGKICRRPERACERDRMATAPNFLPCACVSCPFL